MPMKLKVRYVYVLAALLVVIGAVTATTALLADPGGWPPMRKVDTPQAPPQTPLTEQEKQDAVDIVSAAGVVKGINGDQEWKHEYIFRATIAGTNGIRLEAVWEKPIDSSGPWWLVQCQGTRKIMSTRQWSGVIRLMLWVDMDRRSVVGYVPFSRPEEESPVVGPASEGKTAAVYDVETNEVIYDGSLSGLPKHEKYCPPGTLYQD